MSGSLDPSIITNAANLGNTNSPMNAVTNAAQMGNQLYSLRQNQANMAAGQDFQQAVGPDGTFDPKKYNALLAADPRASLAAVQSSQAGQTNQTTQLTNQQQQMQLGLAHLTYVANKATGYAENLPTKKDVINDATDAMNEHILDAPTAAALVSRIPFDAPPAVQKAYFKNAALQASAGIGQISRFLPQTQPISAGGSTIMGQSNPLAPGYTAPGSVVTNSPSAEFQSSPQTITTPAGSSATGTPSQLGIPMPAATITPPGGAPPGSGYGPAGLAPIGGSSPAAGNGVAPSAGPLASGPVTVPAGAATSAAALAQDQTGSFSQDVQTASNTAPVMSSITELAASARGFKPGPISGQIAQLNSLAQELGLPAATDSASAEQTAAKASGMILAQNLSGFGASTDAKLGAAMGITPNGTMSGEGLAATAAMTAGNKLYQLRLGQAAQQWRQQGGNPADPSQGYNAFKLQFQNQTSPLVLALPYMPASQIKDLQAEIKTLPGDQQRAIDQQIKTSMQNGWLSAPGQ